MWRVSWELGEFWIGKRDYFYGFLGVEWFTIIINEELQDVILVMSLLLTNKEDGDLRFYLDLGKWILCRVAEFFLTSTSLSSCEMLGKIWAFVLNNKRASLTSVWFLLVYDNKIDELDNLDDHQSLGLSAGRQHPIFCFFQCLPLQTCFCFSHCHVRICVSRRIFRGIFFEYILSSSAKWWIIKFTEIRLGFSVDCMTKKPR